MLSKTHLHIYSNTRYKAAAVADKYAVGAKP